MVTLLNPTTKVPPAVSETKGDPDDSSAADSKLTPLNSVPSILNSLIGITY